MAKYSSLSTAANGQQNKNIYSVSALNAAVSLLIEAQFPQVWIEGEVSNMARPGSGHWYFSLKDAHAQIRCAMFRQQNRVLDFNPQQGDQVLVKGRISLYEPRGDFQLIVHSLEPYGFGALQAAFERLKLKLSQQGYFEAEKKQAIPTLPQQIGLITSPTGAAVHDVLTVLARRCPWIPIVIYPTQVQGKAAQAAIVKAIAKANQSALCDVLILARGGGSLEDLWAFNEESVAQAISDSTLPVVTGIGHETDTCIADFIADRRAATPSAAAELVGPDMAQWQSLIASSEHRLTNVLNSQIEQLKNRLNSLAKRLQHPSRTLQQQAQRLDDTEQKLLFSLQVYLQQRHSQMREQTALLQRFNPIDRLKTEQGHLQNLATQLNRSISHQLNNKSTNLAASIRALDSVSPLATLDRGYAIMQNSQENLVINSIKNIKVGDPLQAQLSDGKLDCVIKEVYRSDA